MLQPLLFSFLSLALITPAIAQSTTLSSPTVLTTKEFSARGPSREATCYFSFTGGPGEVSVTLKINTAGYSTFAKIELLTTGNIVLGAHNLNATIWTGPVQVVKTIELKKLQKVVLRLSMDQHLSEYGITLGGKVINLINGEKKIGRGINRF